MRTRILIAALGMAVVLAMAARPGRADLVAHYEFDAADATDLSGNGNDGTPGSLITFETSTPTGAGLSARFYGTYNPATPNSSIVVPTSPSLEAIDDTLTVAFWMRADGDDNGTWPRLMEHGNEQNTARTWLVCRYNGTDDVNMRVDTQPNDGITGRHNQNIARSSVPLWDDEWHHVAFVLDNGSWAKYVDGQPEGTGSYKHGDGLYNTRPFYIGGRNTSGEYNGYLDQVVIYDSPLDAGLVSLLYNGAPPANLPEPATMTLLALGGLGALLRRRRR